MRCNSILLPVCLLPKSVTHAALLLLVMSPLLSGGKRLPNRAIHVTDDEAEEIQFEDEAAQTDAGEYELYNTEIIHTETVTPSSDENFIHAAALIARNVVHDADQVAISYISPEGYTKGQPTTFLIPTSDGPENFGKGTLYFYMSESKWGIGAILKFETECTLFIPRHDASDCDYGKLPIENPRCEHVILTGKFQKISKFSQEYIEASNNFFSRHPHYSQMNHVGQHFFVKFHISKILVYFAAERPIEVPVNAYYEAATRMMPLDRDFGQVLRVKKLLLLVGFLVSIVKIFM